MKEKLNQHKLTRLKKEKNQDQTSLDSGVIKGQPKLLDKHIPENTFKVDNKVMMHDMDTLKSNLKRIPFLKLTEVEVTKVITETYTSHEVNPQKNVGGVSPLCVGDLEKVMALQKEIYQENHLLEKPHWKMQALLLAGSTVQKMRQETNLSFIYRDIDNKVIGYFIAYKGVKKGVGDVVYITDWMGAQANRITSGRLMLTFLKAYTKGYIDEGKSFPVYMNARKSTTMKVVTKQIETFSKIVNENLTNTSNAIKFIIKVLNTRIEAEEVFYDVLISPVPLY